MLSLPIAYERTKLRQTKEWRLNSFFSNLSFRETTNHLNFKYLVDSALVDQLDAKSKPKVNGDYQQSIRERLNNAWSVSRKDGVDRNLNVKYKFAGYLAEYQIGRVFAVHGVSFGSLKQAVRNTLLRDRYIDIDMVNCHPTLCLHLAGCLFTEAEFPILSRLVSDRESLFSELMAESGFTRQEVKVGFLKIIYGGKFKITGKLVQDFTREINILKKELAHRNPELLDVISSHRLESKDPRGLKNIQGALLSVVMQDWERRLLEEVVYFLEEKKVIQKVKGKEKALDVILCYDGLMVPTMNCPADMDKLLLECQQHLKHELGIFMMLSVKSMDEYFTNEEIISSKKEKEISSMGSTFPKTRTELPVDSFNFIKLHKFIEESDAEGALNYCRMYIFPCPQLGGFFLWEPERSHPADPKKTLACFTFRVDPAIGKYMRSNFEIVFKDGRTVTTSNLYKEYQKILDVFEPIFDPAAETIVFTNQQGVYKLNLNPGYWINVTDPGIVIDDKVIALFKIYLYEVLSSSKELNYEMLIQWLARALSPYHRNKTGLNMVADQGLGKSTIRVFLERILGYLFALVQNEDHFLSRFNGFLSAKKVVFLEELATKKNAHHVYKRMKDYITGDTLMLEDKGEKHRIEANFTSWITTSNYSYTSCIDTDDRRLFMLDLTEKKDPEYWTQLYSHLDNEKSLQMMGKWIID